MAVDCPTKGAYCNVAQGEPFTPWGLAHFSAD